MITRTLLCLLLGVAATGCLFFETGSTNNTAPDMTTTPDMTEPDMPSANNCKTGCAELAVEPYSCDGEVLSVFVTTEVDSDCSCVVVYDKIDCALTGQVCDEENGECVDGSPDVCAEDIDCGPGQACCDEECVDVSADADNCGGCGYTCVEGAVCSDSLCLCEPAPSTATNAPPAYWTQLSASEENILANPPPLLIPFLNNERVNCEPEGCSLLTDYPPTSAHHIAVYSRNSQSFTVQLLDELGSVLANAVESNAQGKPLIQIRAFRLGTFGEVHLAALWGTPGQTQLQMYRVNVDPSLGAVGLRLQPLANDVMVTNAQNIVDYDISTWNFDGFDRMPALQMALRQSGLTALTYLTKNTTGAYRLTVIMLFLKNGALTISQAHSFDLALEGEPLPGTWSTGAGFVQAGDEPLDLGIGAAFMTNSENTKQALHFGQVVVRASLNQGQLEFEMGLLGQLAKLGEFFKASPPEGAPTRVNVSSSLDGPGNQPHWEILGFLADTSAGTPPVSKAVFIEVPAKGAAGRRIDDVFTLPGFGFQGSATFNPPSLDLFVSWIVSTWNNGTLSPQRQIHYSVLGGDAAQMYLLARDAEFTSTRASFGTRGAGVLAHVRVPGNSSIRFYPVLSGRPYCGLTNMQP